MSITSAAADGNGPDGPSSPAAAVEKLASYGLHVSSCMDSGNIEVVDAPDDTTVLLAIRPDPYCATDSRAHAQWFNFRLVGACGREMRLQLVNAGEASYAAAYGGYRACASYDMQDWFRVPTAYDPDSGVLTISHSPEHDAVQYAYFAPYSLDRAATLLARTLGRSRPDALVRLQVLGRTLDGRDLELLRATFFVVRNINPDGSFRGHLRTNAAGTNLNRAWAAPSLDSSPEVFHTLRAIEKEGVDMFVDVHGDEDLPHVFIAGLEGIPRWDSRLAGLQAAFCDAFGRHAPEFQATRGYGADKPGSANLTVASKQIGQRFACLSVTLEMPFKDCAELPNERVGWSPGRSKRLGAALLGAVNDILHMLR